MLPTPWGLVRSGVAPDHPKIKSISAQFDKTAADARFRFFGNIKVGEHVTPGELAQRYDAVVYAIGAQSDRALNIPGEELPGSVAAVDFVGWYNAHPHFDGMAPNLAGGRAVVVGNGNVALDVARILVSDPQALANTDIADHALASLDTRGVEEVVVIGRRGPLQATFTTLELRELGDMEGLVDVDVVLDPADFAGITDDDLEAAGKTVKQNIKVLRKYVDEPPREAKRRIVFRFCTSPSNCAARSGSSRSCWAATNLYATTTAAWWPRTPGSVKSCRSSWWYGQSVTAACRHRACRSTNAPGRFRTPTAESRAAATSTWWAGSNADRPA